MAEYETFQAYVKRAAEALDKGEKCGPPNFDPEVVRQLPNLREIICDPCYSLKNPIGDRRD